MLEMKCGWPACAPASPLCIEKCRYERYSGGMGWSLLMARLCFLTLRYPNTETKTINTTNPMQQPMMSPSRRVRMDCTPREWSGRIPRPPWMLSGAPRVLTSAHLLVGESTSSGSMASLNISRLSRVVSFSGLRIARRDSAVSLRCDAQFPRASTHIKYLVPGYSLESFMDREERSSILPRIWNKGKKWRWVTAERSYRRRYNLSQTVGIKERYVS